MKSLYESRNKECQNLGKPSISEEEKFIWMIKELGNIDIHPTIVYLFKYHNNFEKTSDVATQIFKYNNKVNQLYKQINTSANRVQNGKAEI